MKPCQFGTSQLMVLLLMKNITALQTAPQQKSELCTVSCQIIEYHLTVIAVHPLSFYTVHK